MARMETEVAMAMLKAGLSVLPASKENKHPKTGRGWGKYMKELPTECEVTAWFANPHDAMCIVAGAVSGNVECIDFDQAGTAFEAWKASIAPELISRLVIETTQSGGYHVAYRCEEKIEKSRTLARRVVEDKPRVLIETRGECATFVCAPSNGYSLIQGDYGHLPVLTAEERRTLLDAATALNEVEASNCRTEASGRASSDSGAVSGDSCDDGHWDTRPGDDFNERGNIRPILMSAGWKYLFTEDNGNEHWRRPGKTEDKTSATYKDGVFFVFSSNAAPFEQNRGYCNFQVYALLVHNGDFIAATADLFRQGFGKARDPIGGVMINLCQRNQAVTAVTEDTTLDCPAECCPKDPGPVPEALLRVPGFVSDYMDYILHVSPYPNRPMAFAASLAMLAHNAGRRYMNADGSRLNLYLLGLGDSGIGKEKPRACNIDLAGECGFVGEMGDSFASGEGLEDAMSVSPSMLFQVDEVDHLFNIVKKKDARAEQISAMLLKFYSESSTIHTMRVKAHTGKDANPVSFIYEPHLTFLGTATPRFFYESLTERTMENGLLARCLIIELGRRSSRNDHSQIAIPKEIIDFIDTMRQPGGDGNMAGYGALAAMQRPQLRIIGQTEEAHKALYAYSTGADSRYNDAQEKSQFNAMALWARAGEKVSKLAGLHALSANAKEPVATVESVSWASALVDHITQRMLFMCSQYVSDGEHDEQRKKFIRILSGNKGSAPRWYVLRRIHLDSKTFDNLADTLIEAGMIGRETTPRKGIVYHLVK